MEAKNYSLQEWVGVRRDWLVRSEENSTEKERSSYKRQPPPCPVEPELQDSPSPPGAGIQTAAEGIAGAHWGAADRPWWCCDGGLARNL